MAVWGVIQNGTIVNVISADSAFVNLYYPGAIQLDTMQPQPGIGWGYAAGRFTPPITITVDSISAKLDIAMPPVVVSATGGDGSYAFTANELPPGLTITPAGVIGGTPTKAGGYLVTILAADGQGHAGSLTTTIAVE